MCKESFITAVSNNTNAAKLRIINSVETGIETGINSIQQINSKKTKGGGKQNVKFFGKKLKSLHRRKIQCARTLNRRHRIINSKLTSRFSGKSFNSREDFTLRNNQRKRQTRRSE